MLTLTQLAELGTRVRLLHPGEVVTLDVGFKNLDAEWVWVLETYGEVVAILLAAPCHGAVQLVRLVAQPGHERLLPRLLRACVKDCVRRGYTGYLSWFDMEQESERRLFRILERGGAVSQPGLHQCVGGSLAQLERW